MLSLDVKCQHNIEVVKDSQDKNGTIPNVLGHSINRSRVYVDSFVSTETQPDSNIENTSKVACRVPIV